MQSQDWDAVLIPQDNILLSDDQTLKDHITKLTKLLERNDLESHDVVMITYYRELYSKFTSENGDILN